MTHGNEFDPEFLNRVSQVSDRVIVLIIINPEEVGNMPSGFVSSRIKHLENTGEKITEYLKRKGVDVTLELEWGNEETLIKEYMKKEKLDAVYRRGEI